MNRLFCMMLVCCLIACNDNKKNPEIPEVPVTIVGKWVSTSLNYMIDDDNGTVTHGVVKAPFDGQIDLIEHLRFTTDSMYFKLSNEPEEDEPFRYFYNAAQGIILVTDGFETDTLFHVSGLSATTLHYTYTEKDTDSNGRIRTAKYNYSAKKQ